MAAITWTDVTSLPDTALATITVLFQNLILEIVNTTGISVKNFGGEAAAKTKLARVLLAAHMATMLLRRGIGGAVASQSEGGVSQSMAQILPNPSALDLTAYGQALRGLSAGTPARAGMLV